MSSSLRSFYLLHNNCQIPLDLESVDAGESADEDIGVMTCWLKNSAKVRLMNDGVAFLSESAECGKMSGLLALRQSPSQIRSLSDQPSSHNPIACNQFLSKPATAAITIMIMN